MTVEVFFRFMMATGFVDYHGGCREFSRGDEWLLLRTMRKFFNDKMITNLSFLTSLSVF